MDPNDFLRATLETIQEMLDRSGRPASEVAALALDGQMSGCMGIDGRGGPAAPWTSTLDTRFSPYLDRFMTGYEPEIRQLNGALQPCFGPKIAWLREELPELYRASEKFVILAGHVAGRLAGLTADDAFMDATYLTITGIADVVNSCWSEDLCEALGIPMEKLPRIVRSTEVVGSLTLEFARVCGLLAGTPIVAGAGDQPAGFLGAGLVEPGMLIDVAGTYPVLSFCTDRFSPDSEGRTVETFVSARPGLWHPLTLIIGGGLTHSWFAGMTLHQAANGNGDVASQYARLDRAASALPPGSEGLLFLPHLGGRACPPDTSMRGAWLGLNWAHSEVHLYRSILESIAYDYVLSLRALMKLYPDSLPDRIRVIGGGARSTLWTQIKADVLGLVYDRVEPDEPAPLGAALIAGEGVGVFEDLAEIAPGWTTVVETTEPDPKRHEQYQEYLQAYEYALNQTSPVFRRLTGIATGPAVRGLHDA